MTQSPRLGAYLRGSLNGNTRHWYTRDHRSSFLAGTNLEATAELGNSLVHALNADAHPSMCPRRGIWACGHSFALVPHLQLHFISLTNDADGGNATPRVTMNVREALLHHPENSGFQFLRESREIVGNFQSYSDFAALFKAFQKQTETGRKTNLIQQRRMQQMRDR